MNDFIHEFQLPGLDIDGLLKANDYDNALRRLLDEIERRPDDDGDQRSLWTKYFLAGRNLFLDWFRAANYPVLSNALHDKNSLPSRFGKLAGQFGRLVTESGEPNADRLWPVVNAVAQYVAPESSAPIDFPKILGKAFRDAVHGWSDDWGIPSFRFGTDATPAFARWLEANQPELFGELQSIADSDEEGQAGCGWGHPALLMLLDLLRGLLHPKPASVDFTAETWALFAADSRGVVGKLTVERLPGGGGYVFPDPLFHAHTRAENHFFSAIEDAWKAVGKACAGHSRLDSCDYRWRLELRSSDATDWQSPWSGSSATAAFAVALRAAVMDEPIDLQSAVSAVLEFDDKTLASDIRLGPISSLRSKQLFESDAMADTSKLCLIFELFVSPTQNTPTEVAGGLKYPRCESFDKLFESMTKFGRMTRDYRAAVIERAKAIKADQCLLDRENTAPESTTPNDFGYVEPRLSQVFAKSDGDELQRRPGQETRDGAQKEDAGPPVRELTTDELRELCRGNLNQLRWPVSQKSAKTKPFFHGYAWIYGGSGLGKSLLLVHVEQQIAEDEGSRLIPFRIGGPNGARIGDTWKEVPPMTSLSGFTWERFKSPDADKEDALDLWSKFALDLIEVQGLFAKAQVIHQGKGREVTPKDIRQWLIRLHRAGRVRYLLDALDQTKEHHELPLYKFVVDAVEEYGNGVLLTGREESQKTQPKAFLSGASDPAKQTNGQLSAAWITLRMEEFNDAQIRQFLGPFADDLLEWQGREERESAADIARKRGWLPLLGIPFVLWLMRDLAAGKELASLSNMAAVYSRAIDRLLAKGRTTISDVNGETQTPPPDIIQDRLIALAAAQVVIEQQPVSQDVDQPLFREMRPILEKLWNTSNADELIPMLAQINVMSAHSLIRRFDRRDLPSVGFSWRHRSFLEYLTARAMLDEGKNQRDEDNNRWIDQLLSRHASAQRMST